VLLRLEPRSLGDHGVERHGVTLSRTLGRAKANPDDP